MAVLSALVLVAGACSKDSDGGDTAPKKDTSSTTADSTEAPGASPDFSETVAAAQKAIDGAKDSCELYVAVSALSTVGNPETKDQTRKAVDFYVAMLNKMADTSSDAANAEILRTGATEFEAFAKKVDYDPEKMDLSGTGPDIKDADKLDAAMNSYATTEFANCEIPGTSTIPGASGTESGSTPEGGTSGN